jgi:hypothetical protein
LLEELEEWSSSEGELLQSVRKAYDDSARYGGVLVPDIIGIGAAAIPTIIELNVARIARGLEPVDYEKFHGGERPSDDIYYDGITYADHFLNLRAEAMSRVSDKARNTYVLRQAVERGDAELPWFEDDELLSISSKIECVEKLITEMSSPRKVIDNSGMTAVEKKVDMLKRNIKSPNLSDAAIMALYKSGGHGFFDSL